MSNEKMREAFEVWAKDNDYQLRRERNVENADYAMTTTSFAWVGWQAATAATQRDAMAVAEAVREAAVTAWESATCQTGEYQAISAIDLAAIVEAVRPEAKPLSMSDSYSDILNIQRDECERAPSDAYMVGLYNGMLMMCCNVDGTDFQPISYKAVRPSKREAVNQQLLRCIEQVEACMDVTQVEPEDNAAWLIVKAAAEAAQPASAQQQGESVAWMFDWQSEAGLIRDWCTISKQELANYKAMNVRPLYTAPPAPACSVPSAMDEVPAKDRDEYALGWNACRELILSDFNKGTTA